MIGPTFAPTDLTGNFDERDNPSEQFIARVRERYPTEREIDEILTRKLRRRADPPYRRPTLETLLRQLRRMLTDCIGSDFDVSDLRWFTGGVSKIQMGFTLRWTDTQAGPRTERLVIRMDPAEGSNTTSRVREHELLHLFDGVLPVPKAYWLDRDARWFPEPALIYSYVPGVTKPTATATGKVSGLGTNFGPELRRLLAPQFLQHLSAIHTLPLQGRQFETMDMPRPGTADSVLWQLNRARRIWEEDRGEDFALMEVAANWLERNMPVPDHVGIVHGDFRSGNFLFDESSGRIQGWLDWERGHIGDRHRDLAWTTQQTMGHYGEDGKTYYVCGLVPLEEFYQRYEDASGLGVDRDRIAYYAIFNCYQILCSVIATGYRVARLGKSHQDVLLTRVKGMAPSVSLDLARLLRERR